MTSVMRVYFILFTVTVVCLLQVEGHSTKNHLYQGATAIVEKLQNCNHVDAKAEILQWNIQACINITLDIAKLENFVYDVYQFGVQVGGYAEELALNVYSCRAELPNVFQLLECAVQAVDNSGPVVDNILCRLYQLIAELQSDYDDLMEDYTHCIGKGNNSTLSDILRLYNQCQYQL